MNVVIGSGTKYFTTDVRGDKEDLLSVIKGKYQFADTPEAMNKVTTGNLWAMFAQTSLAYDFDRDPQKEPSLAEMTDKAIDLLSQDKDGFFLMVEGSKVDWAAHANDPIGIISDVLAFDEAVGVARDFAEKDGKTLIISVTDHGNSGITIGNSATNSSYDKTPLSVFIDPLKKASLTGEGLEQMLNADRSNIVEVMKNYYGISDLTTDEIKAIKDAKAGELNYTVGPMIAKRADIGFTTTGHTGEDVVLYVYAPSGIDQLTGTVENTDIAKYMEKAMGLSLSKTTEKLFVNAKTAFEAKGAAVELDTATDANNPVLIVTKGNLAIKLPVNKNIAFVNDVPTTLDGETIYNGETVYVPQSAVKLIK
jgi:alkaline phosphatase